MKEIQLIHIVESSKSYAWFEKLFAYLDTKGFTQAVITLEPKGEINKLLLAGKIPVRSPKSKRIIISSFQAIRSVRNLRKDGHTNFLILHGHKSAIVGSLAARVTNLEFGIIHHVQPKYFQLLKTQYPLRGSLHQFIYRFYVTRAQIVQALSKEVTNSLNALGCDSKRIVSVGHGVDFEVFQNSLENTNGDIFGKLGFPRVLMVGRLAWEKNYSLAIEVFAELCKSYPEAQLLIAGSGPAEKELKTLIEKFNLAENVSLLGRVGNVPKLMLNSDLLMHFALTESYGQVYIEACLSGLPIFTFPVGIAIDLSEESDSLIHILTQNSPEWISGQICKFLETSPKRQPPDITLMRSHYLKHDQKVVFQEMSDYLTRLVPELD